MLTQSFKQNIQDNPTSITGGVPSNQPMDDKSFNEWIKPVKDATSKPSVISQVGNIGNEMTKTYETAGKDTITNVKTALGKSQTEDQGSFGKNFLADLTKRLSATGHIAGDIAGTAFAPVLHVVSALIPPEIKKDSEEAVNWVADKLTNNPAILGIANHINSTFDANPDLKKSLTSDLPNSLALLGGSKVNELNPKVDMSGVTTDLKNLKTNITEAPAKIKSSVGDTTKGVLDKIKESISPTLTPDEQIGKIIQGKTTDIPAAQRTFKTLSPDVNPAKMSPEDLSNTIQGKIKSNLDTVDSHFTNDTTTHPMKDFEQTTGKGTSAVKTNYVQQSIDQLKDFYTKTNDAQGLSDIKGLEEKANTEGLSSKELNDLAKEHGSTIKAFNANGEAASGLTKQAAENTRAGVKTTARDMLGKTDTKGATEVTRLDKETSDAIHTKDLLDKQVETEARGVQKKGKPNAVEKWAKNNPKKARAVKYGATAVIGGEAIKHVLP